MNFLVEFAMLRPTSVPAVPLSWIPSCETGRCALRTGTTEPLSPVSHAGSELRHVTRESGANDMFLSSPCNGSYSPPARSHGAVTGPGVTSASAGQSQMIDSSPAMMSPGLMRPNVSAAGTKLSESWSCGDEPSPSKFLSGSPSAST